VVVAVLVLVLVAVVVVMISNSVQKSHQIVRLHHLM
jgi:hypothetical protein